MKRPPGIKQCVYLADTGDSSSRLCSLTGSSFCDDHDYMLRATEERCIWNVQIPIFLKPALSGRVLFVPPEIRVFAIQMLLSGGQSRRKLTVGGSNGSNNDFREVKPVKT